MFIFAIAFTACEDVSEPFSIEDGAIPAYVKIQTEDTEVLAGGSLEVQVELGQTQEENVIVDFEIDGDAVEGEDYIMSGTDNGSFVIEHDPDATTFDNHVIELEFPIEAALGTARELTIVIVGARTADSGRELTIGRGDRGASRTYTINGLGEVETGTYEYDAAGDFEFDGTFEVTQPDDPIMVDGNPYLYETSNIAGGLFGYPVAYAFNVTAAGDIMGAPYSHGQDPDGDELDWVVLNVGGSYDPDTNTLILDYIFECCGADGANVIITATLLD